MTDEARDVPLCPGYYWSAISAATVRGEAEDVAPFTVTWLASDEAAHVNGHIFHVTDGLVTPAERAGAGADHAYRGPLDGGGHSSSLSGDHRRGAVQPGPSPADSHLKTNL